MDDEGAFPARGNLFRGAGPFRSRRKIHGDLVAAPGDQERVLAGAGHRGQAQAVHVAVIRFEAGKVRQEEPAAGGAEVLRLIIFLMNHMKKIFMRLLIYKHDMKMALVILLKKNHMN